MRRTPIFLALFAVCAALIPLRGQAIPIAQQAAAPAVPPPPATKLEAFRPSAGSVQTFGYNELGKIRGISIDAREVRDTKGAAARGLVVEVSESEYRQERAFIDADEIPELLRGIDAILDLKANPTRFENFEASYQTRGELQITAYNYEGKISYSIRAGRTLHASRVGLSAAELDSFRAMVAKGVAALAAASGK